MGLRSLFRQRPTTAGATEATPAAAVPDVAEFPDPFAVETDLDKRAPRAVPQRVDLLANPIKKKNKKSGGA
jgi:hypothetical protein